MATQPETPAGGETSAGRETSAAGQTPGPAHADVDGLGYEEARDQLVALVARLESGQVGLDESMGLWQRGEALAAHCSQWLDRAEARIADDA